VMDPALTKKEDLEILEVESESEPTEGTVRVDPGTRTLVWEKRKR
jgi:hypothetical protein